MKEEEEEEEEEEEWVFKQIFFFLAFWEEKQGNRLFGHGRGKKCLANMKGS